MSSVGALTPKQVSWWKKSILRKRPPLSYHTDGLRIFVDVIGYPFEEKLTQLKSHQQLYVPLLKDSIMSKSTKEEFSMFQPKIWCDEAIVKKSVEED